LNFEASKKQKKNSSLKTRGGGCFELVCFEIKQMSFYQKDLILIDALDALDLII
jgi:hypothetical protein